MTKAVTAKNKNGPASFPITLVVGGLAALVVGFQTFRLVLAKRKIAALAHKAVVLEEGRREDGLNKILAKTKVVKDAVNKRIKERNKKIKAVRKIIADKEKAAEDFATKLGGAKSWADIKIKK